MLLSESMFWVCKFCKFCCISSLFISRVMTRGLSGRLGRCGGMDFSGCVVEANGWMCVLRCSLSIAVMVGES